MPDLFLYAVFALCALYLFLVAAFVLGLYRTPPANSADCPTVAIIVPARNEASNIDACLCALSAQTYPADRLEIVIVDDRSTDGTADLARQWTHRIPSLKCVSVSEPHYACPKKNALHHGIRATQSDLVFTTDADCRPGPDWITSTVCAFAPDTGMVIGHAPLTPGSSLRSQLLALQGLAVAALAAGSAGIGFPLTCSGRNLAYRRRAFEDADGFDAIGHITGGDDVLLMRRIAKTPWRIRSHAEAPVPSAPHPDNQCHRQVRYQSKAIHYGIPILILALAVYIFHIILFLLPVWLWIDPTLFLPLSACLLLKTTADGLLLHLSARHLKTRSPILWLPLIELLLIPYVAVICALGALAPFKWK